MADGWWPPLWPGLPLSVLAGAAFGALTLLVPVHPALLALGFVAGAVLVMVFIGRP